MAALTEQRRLVLKPTPLVNCENLLENVREVLEPLLDEVVSPGALILQVGVYKDLQRIAIASGMDRQTAIQAVKFVEQGLEANRNRETVLGTTLKYLEKFRKNDQALLVCVLTGTCYLPVGTSFVPDESQLSMAQLRTTRMRQPLNGRIPHLILMNGGPMPYLPQGIPGPPAAVGMAWAIDFLTAATAFADYELVKDWIAANTALLKAGHRSDEIFDRFARIVPKQNVDTGFYRALTSSRATASTLTLVPMGPAAGLREQAMAEIRMFPDETKNVASHYNLSEQNIVEFGQIVTAQMLETIRRAAKL